MSKTELRQAMKRLTLLHQAERQTLSERVTAKVLSEPHLQAARVVMLYSSLPDEVDTEQLIAVLQRQGKRILLPVVQGDNMIAVEVSADTRYHTGSFGIKEPEPLPYQGEIDVVIVPGRAFDKQGHRLGRGGGYYDRFLADRSTYKIGICFPCQLLDEIPHDIHDIPMDCVITA